jgi:hypothetical protein
VDEAVVEEVVVDESVVVDVWVDWACAVATNSNAADSIVTALCKPGQGCVQRVSECLQIVGPWVRDSGFAGMKGRDACRTTSLHS